ncbi:ABC transporter permease [Prolixibacteraceae bacterium Z1-6]|uniref:ABC transporter permease n=1 Tax=Draconibacterium aestuarii TaxID=2998507 RepID=A0A9X3J4E4_9BACT|nr:ABC transporter permease [Prolixibacteraceae bacterium Z1-6]
MLKHSLKLIARQLFKGNRQLLLNVLGLSVAFAIVLFLSTFILTEMRRGKTVANFENIYRLKSMEGTYWSSRSLKEFENKFPEIRSMTKLHPNWSKTSFYEVGQQQYQAGKIIVADTHFFDVFNHETIVGNLSNVLAVKDNIVITEAEAKKVFGKTDVVGKGIRFMTADFGVMDLTVAAVIKDLPQEAMMKFDAIIPVEALNNNVSWYDSDHWGNSRYEVFISLQPNNPIAELEEKLNSAFLAAAPDWAKTDKGEIFLKSYSSLYFSESGEDKVVSHGSSNQIRTLGTIMLIVFLLAIINFINLNTAQKIKQTKNIGIHKTLGANGWDSFVRMISEVLPVLIITFGMAIVLVGLSLPWLNNLFGTEFSISGLLDINTLVVGTIIIALGLFLSTIFISLYFQRVKPYEALKNSMMTGKKEYLRNALLVVQFTLSIVLVIGSMVVYKQNMYMQNQTMGFKKDNILYLPLRNDMNKQTKAIKQELASISEVSAITLASHPLGKSDMGWGMSLNNAGEDKRISYEAMMVEENFFDFFGLDIVEGEGFSSSSIREHEHIFNQFAVKEFGIKNITEARITSYDNASGQIIGVVKDFNFQSLHHPISPIGFICSEPENLSIAYLNLNVSDKKQLQTAMNKIETVWDNFSGDWPFEYHFLDQTLDDLYNEDQKFSKIFLLATILSVFIGCLGLLSTVIFIAEMRIKEIGIRKVNGAKITEILTMLNKDFIKWVAIAFVIATPLAWFAMNKWLENFAYKTTLSWWIFALAGVLALGIALLTVSWQSWRAATRNPVEALRYE